MNEGGGGGGSHLQSSYNPSGGVDHPHSLTPFQGSGLAQGQGLGQGQVVPYTMSVGTSVSRGGSGGSGGGISGNHPNGEGVGGGNGSGNGSGNSSFMGAGGGVMTVVRGGGDGSPDPSMIDMNVSDTFNGPAGPGQNVGEEGGNIVTVNPYNTTNLHVLVVDDSSINRKMLIKVLNNLKYTSEEAEDGIQAVHLMTRAMRLLQQQPQVSSSHSNVGKQHSNISNPPRSMSIQLSPSAITGGKLCMGEMCVM